LSNGELEHLGRLDTQVKIRGFRIELKEIENALSNIAEIKDCMVTVQTINSHEELVAYIVLNSKSIQSQSEQNKSELAIIKTSLRTKLPGYMVPSHFVLLERFPLNSNGKIDKKKLPIPTYVPVAADKSDEISLSPTEKELLEIWRNLLLNDYISINDNFFELGGHSLLAIKLISIVNQAFNCSLTPKDIFKSPTIATLAKAIENMVLKSVSAKNLVKIHDGIGENIFLVPGIDGDAYSFFNLGKYSELNNTLYSLEYPKPKEDNLTFDTMQDLALYFIEKIKIIQPTGRYNLVGYSFGGRLVFEMAIQLQKTGNEIGLLTMIDTVGFTKLFDYKSGIIINAFEQFYIFSTLGISEKMNYLKYRLSFMLKSLFLRVTSVRSPLIQSEENDSDFMDNTMSILNNYETKNIFNGNIYLIKSSLSIYPKSRKTYYLNVLYPSLYWNKNIKGNINITSIECGHFDFLKLENIDKIIRVIDGYFKIKS
jgi:thioesterase domain-containing protein/acyl carrier protein